MPFDHFTFASFFSFARVLLSPVLANRLLSQNPTKPKSSSTMEFWGVELKGDTPLKVVPVMNEVIHLSQATLADLKKGSKPVMLSVKVGDQKLAIGVLNADSTPQLSFDLVFEKEFELSHNMKNGCVHLTGYKSLMGEEEGDQFFDSSDEDDEAFPLEDKQNGVAALTAATKAKPAAPVAVAKKDVKSEDESDDDSDEEGSDEDDSDVSDKEMVVVAAEDSDSEEGDSDSEDDDSESDDSESEEELPQKSAGGKKRPATDTKTPEVKKAKLVTPQKTAGKKAAVHVDTPHPAKNAGKGDKSNVKTPKSTGQVTCGSCSKSFNSQNALDSHSKAKHSK